MICSNDELVQTPYRYTCVESWRFSRACSSWLGLFRPRRIVIRFVQFYKPLLNRSILYLFLVQSRVLTGFPRQLLAHLTKELVRPKKYFFIWSTNLFLHQYGVKVVFAFIEVWVKNNSLLMLVTYLALFPIFHSQCNQDKDLQAPAQGFTDDTK